jgi:hypothetical protein
MFFPITEEEIDTIKKYQNEILKESQNSSAIDARQKKQWEPFGYIVSEIWHLYLLMKYQTKIFHVHEMKKNTKFVYNASYKSDQYSIIYEDKFYMICRALYYRKEQVRIFKKNKRFFPKWFYTELAVYEINKGSNKDCFEIEELKYSPGYDFLPLFISVKEYYLRLIQDEIDKKIGANIYADLIDNVYRRRTND